jgi:eukaryotic-like serine/threonine-protein kinase
MTWTDADRDRLVGLLAVRAGLIDLEGASVDVTQGAGNSLDRTLVEPERTALESLARVIMDRHWDDPAGCLAGLGDRAEGTIRKPSPEPEPSPTDDDAFATRIPTDLTTAQSDPFATRLPFRDPAQTGWTLAASSGLEGSAHPSSTGRHRFHRLRPHAKGGLGEVFLAHDQELRRHVALKEIQEQHADHQDNRSRFVLEAEITGGLEHPGIVPVYGMGITSTAGLTTPCGSSRETR